MLKKNIEFGTFRSVIRDYGLRICVQGAISTTIAIKGMVSPKTAFRDLFLRFSAQFPIFLQKNTYKNPLIYPLYPPGGRRHGRSPLMNLEPNTALCPCWQAQPLLALPLRLSVVRYPVEASGCRSRATTDGIQFPELYYMTFV